MIVAPVPWDVGTALVSMGVEEVSFVCLEAGGLALGVWEPATKFRISHPTWKGQTSSLLGHGGRKGPTSKRGGSLLGPGKSV